ncbi:hypothetical protein C8R45DRAFT_947290 [Mycena sanguinolenta]|nr:hypothetical protein C8R45DRAFT_947290 [Mycena sanguinolenta]
MGGLADRFDGGDGNVGTASGDVPPIIDDNNGKNVCREVFECISPTADVLETHKNSRIILSGITVVKYRIRPYSYGLIRPFVTVTVANLGNNGLGFSSDFQLAGHRTSFKIKERGFVAQGTIVQALRATDPPVTVTKLGLGNTTDPSVTVTVAYIQSAVKTLYIGGIFGPGCAAIPQILATCTGVTSVVVGQDVTPYLASLNAIQSLSSLSVDLGPIFENQPMEFPQPMFRQLTHLEVGNSLWDPETVQKFCTGLTLLSHLTHISFSRVKSIDRFHLRLRKTPLPRLVCTVFRSTADYERKNHWPASDDPRFVTVGEEATWEKRQHDLMDGSSYWAIAEAFVSAKRAGQIRQPWGRAPDRMSDGCSYRTAVFQSIQLYVILPIPPPPKQARGTGKRNFRHGVEKLNLGHPRVFLKWVIFRRTLHSDTKFLLRMAKIGRKRMDAVIFQTLELGRPTESRAKI